jgi:transcriptional regulator with XRE-family HTH domain
MGGRPLHRDAYARPRAVDPADDAFQPWRPETDSVRTPDASGSLAEDVRRLGAVLRDARRQSGRSQGEVARAAEVSVRHLRRLEAGERLTRRTTLLRIAGALAGAAQDSATTHQLFASFMAAARGAVAEESAYSTRVEERRARRAAEFERNDHELTSVARVPLLGGGWLERRVVDMPGEGRRQRQRSLTYVLINGDGTGMEIDSSPEVLKIFRDFPVRWSRYGG